jgi:putative transposase
MVSMGVRRENVFVGRLWRSFKYEEVYLRAYNTASEARASIGRHLDFYDLDVAATPEKPINAEAGPG